MLIFLIIVLIVVVGFFIMTTCFSRSASAELIRSTEEEKAIEPLLVSSPKVALVTCIDPDEIGFDQYTIPTLKYWADQNDMTFHLVKIREPRDSKSDGEDVSEFKLRASMEKVIELLSTKEFDYIIVASHRIMIKHATNKKLLSSLFPFANPDITVARAPEDCYTSSICSNARAAYKFDDTDQLYRTSYSNDFIIVNAKHVFAELFCKSVIAQKRIVDVDHRAEPLPFDMIGQYNAYGITVVGRRDGKLGIVCRRSDDAKEFNKSISNRNMFPHIQDIYGV